jgi:hypothetical protein
MALDLLHPLHRRSRLPSPGRVLHARKPPPNPPPPKSKSPSQINRKHFLPDRIRTLPHPKPPTKTLHRALTAPLLPNIPSNCAAHIPLRRLQLRHHVHRAVHLSLALDNDLPPKLLHRKSELPLHRRRLHARLPGLWTRLGRHLSPSHPIESPNARNAHPTYDPRGTVDTYWVILVRLVGARTSPLDYAECRDRDIWDGPAGRDAVCPGLYDRVLWTVFSEWDGSRDSTEEFGGLCVSSFRTGYVSEAGLGVGEYLDGADIGISWCADAGSAMEVWGEVEGQGKGDACGVNIMSLQVVATYT